MGRFILLLVVVTSHVGCLAQVSYWVSGGVNLSGTTYDLNYPQDPNFVTRSSTTPHVGFHVGLGLDIPVGRFSVRSEVLYTQLDSEWKTTSDNYNYDPPIYNNYVDTRFESRRYVMVPVQLLYHVKKLRIGLGGYVSQGLTGYYKLTEETIDLVTRQYFVYKIEGEMLPDTAPKNSVQPPYYNPFDAGLIASVGLVFERVMLSVQYQYGLVNTLPYGGIPDWRENHESMNRNLAIQVSCRIN